MADRYARQMTFYKSSLILFLWLCNTLYSVFVWSSIMKCIRRWATGLSKWVAGLYHDVTIHMRGALSLKAHWIFLARDRWVASTLWRNCWVPVIPVPRLASATTPLQQKCRARNGVVHHWSDGMEFWNRVDFSNRKRARMNKSCAG